MEASVIGIILALVALLTWGFGDFFIQRATRQVGSWKTLFFNGVVGSLALTPFVWRDLPALDKSDWLLLGVLSIVTLFAALFDFEALRRGKIPIIEPILGAELPLTAGLSVIFVGEVLSAPQFVLIGVIFIGIILAITQHHTHLHYHKRIFEKGVILAGIGMVGMALMNVLVGVTSQEISPLIAMWFIDVVLAAACGVYLMFRGELLRFPRDLKRHPRALVGQSVFDNVAWVAFAGATTFIPIAVATAISESYIVLAVLLGLFVTREKVRPHQKVGLAFAVAGVITLSIITV